MQQQLARARAAVDQIVLGKQEQTRLAMACLLAGGHLLVEDLPGVGKTTLALTLARVAGLPFQRIQFTSDLLPADILGVSIYNTQSSSFRFEAGPIFTSVLLADEINRASPKTQSALLEAMEERQVTVEGATRPLPDPFFVIATQNPRAQTGTYALPESQLDRFLMRIALGYPDADAERELLAHGDRRARLEAVEPVLDAETIRALQAKVRDIHVSSGLAEYLLALLRHSRERTDLRFGLSPRAGLALRRAAQAWALLDGRSGVLPEDVQAVFAAVVQHRLHADSEMEGATPDAHHLLAAVPIP